MTLGYYHYLAMTLPSDYGVKNMFEVFHDTYSVSSCPFNVELKAIPKIRLICVRLRTRSP